MKSSAKKKSRVVKVNMEGVETAVLVPEEDYLIVPAKVTKEVGESSGKDFLAWEFEITSGKMKGKTLFYNTSLQPQALWNLRGVLEAFGQEVPDSTMEVDLDALEAIDTPAGCTVEHEPYEGRKRARIVDIFAADNVETGEEATTDELPTDEDIDGCDADDLAEVVSQFELDVDLDSIKLLSKKKTAVKEALEAKRTEPIATGGDELPTDEDVDGMSAEELEEVVTTYELDVDLDKVKLLSKKKTAVKEGLAMKREETGGEVAAEDLPTEEDLKDLTAEELEEVVTTYELDVDLDKVKLLSKKRAAVAEALEAKREAGGAEEGAVSEDDVLAMGSKDLAAFVKEHKLKVTLSGSLRKQRRTVTKAAQEEGLIAS
jgi:hypothetical protein